LYGFPQDDPDLTAPQLQKIEAALIDKYQPPSHCGVELYKYAIRFFDTWS
jgi:hypothetical protein